MSRAANRAEIEKLKKAADDQTLSTQERIKAAEKAAAMEKEDLKIQTDLAKARIANMLGYTKVTKEALKTIEDMQNTLNSIRQEGADKAKEAKQTELEAVRAAEDAMLALVKDKREQARKEIELNYSRQIEDLQISLKQEENLTAKAREAINAKIKALSIFV
jgi:septal ring factor EnvC (AmiA/AmiB activator)